MSRDSPPGSLLSALLRLASPTLDAGLAVAEGAFTRLERLVEQAAGRPPPERPTGAPLEGPRELDAATAELANRWLRTARTTPLAPDHLARAARRLLADTARLLPAGDPRRWPAIPLSLASLTLQEMRRGLATAEVVPAERMGDFLAFVAEIFSDLELYFGLAYQEELERWRRRLAEAPGDARARLELGRTLTKCGLFREAAEELRRAADEPAVRRQALYEELVARHRGGELERAVQAGVAALELGGEQPRTRYWLWLTAQRLGGYPEEVPPAARMEVRDGFAPTALRLEEVAGPMGLDKVSGGRGTAVADFHGDGRLDVAVAGAHAGVSLFRNDGGGRFTDVSTGSGLDRCVYGFALAPGDYDNDGRADLFITSLGFFNGRSMLMRNDGPGADGRLSFTDVTEEAGLANWGPAFTATWVDYDCDGLLDLYVVFNLGGLFDRKTDNRLFRNNGDGTFTDVTAEVGLTSPWPTIGACWGDFFNDGWPALFLSGLGRNQLFRSNGPGPGGRVTFTDVSREAGVDRAAIGSVALAADVDDDGWLDIVQLTYSRPEEAIHTLRTGQGPPWGSPPAIWRNNGDGTFTDVARELGVTGCWGTMSAAAGDLDNDGRLELALGNGDPSMDRTEATVLLQRDVAGRFRNVAFSAGLPFGGKGHGTNLADLTGDGRLHLIVAAGGLYPGDLAATEVYRPRQRPGSYLAVRLVGTASNRDAIGARLTLTAAGRRQHRLVSGGSGFGCLPYAQHFGLGEATAVEALQIRWPSGHLQALTGLPADATLEVVEGRPGYRRLDPATTEPDDDR